MTDNLPPAKLSQNSFGPNFDGFSIVAYELSGRAESDSLLQVSLLLFFHEKDI